jgi:hypothetical protein
MEAVVFTATRQEWTTIQRRVTAQGIPVSTDSGEAEQKGVRLRWQYDEAAGRLTVECIKKPRLYPASMVASEIRSKFAALKG